MAYHISSFWFCVFPMERLKVQDGLSHMEFLIFLFCFQVENLIETWFPIQKMKRRWNHQDECAWSVDQASTLSLRGTKEVLRWKVRNANFFFLLWYILLTTCICSRISNSFREHSFREQPKKLVSWALVSWAAKKTRFVSTRFVSSRKNSFRERAHEFREQFCSRVLLEFGKKKFACGASYTGCNLI